MNKRILTLLVTLLLLFSLTLTGCDETITTAIETTNDPNETTGGNDPNEIPVLETAEELGIMTFNLRYDVTSHACMALDVRGPHLMEIIDKYSPDSVGFNEATSNWMYWLRGNMEERGYAYVGVGRDTGTDKTTSKANGNEYSPVFYKVDKFELLDSGTFWLSETPAAAVTKGWGSGYNRICTYAILKNKNSGEIYAHLSTHLDHKDVEAQQNSIDVIETYIRSFLDKYGDIGIVLSGDFNTAEFQTNDPSYKSITYNRASSFMDDTRYLATELGVIGKTFMGYDPVQWEAGYETDKDKPNIDTSSAPIDFIFVRKGAYTCSYYTVVNDTFTFELNGKTWHNHPVSDHYGVFAKVTCNKPTTPFTKNDSKLVDYRANYSTTIPDNLFSKYTEELSISSNLKTTNEKNAITNLLLEDGSNTVVNVNGRQHGYWEITIEPEADTNLQFNGLSFKTADGTVPFNVKVFVSDDGKEWKQVGKAYDEKLAANSTYYLQTVNFITTHYVRISFTDTPTFAKLNNITLYAVPLSNGRIKADRITVTAGPNLGNSEGAQYLFDGTEKKFYKRQYEDNAVPTTPEDLEAIYFQTDTPVKITNFNMVNGNDTATHTGRLPRKWTLYGSTDGTNYVEIDCETNPKLSTENLAVKNFTVDSPGTYQYYKLVFVVGYTGNVQFAEMELYE